MGIGGISIWQLLIVLAIVVLLFGTKRLRTLGSDMGSAIKGFRSAVSTEEKANEDESGEADTAQQAEAAEQEPDKTTQ